VAAPRRALALREAPLLRRAALRACRARALGEAARRPSRFKARRVARALLADGRRDAPVRPRR